MSAGSDGARQQAEAALARLLSVLTGVAADVEARMHERCPYRTRQDGCTFAGGCVNQRRSMPGGERRLQCAGDHALRRTGPC